MEKHLLTSRFNNKTKYENADFLKRHENKIGCVYCSPVEISKKIPQHAMIFVLELNIETNKVMGIGMIKNHPICGNNNNKLTVYENRNYNRYVHTGKYRIDRKDMDDEEEKLMKAFDVICFTGKYHMKRGQGLIAFPTKIIETCKKNGVIDLLDFIAIMFKKHHLEKININKP